MIRSLRREPDAIGTPLDAANIRREFRKITEELASAPDGRRETCATPSSP